MKSVIPVKCLIFSTVLLIVLLADHVVLSVDLNYSDITIVDDSSRFRVLNPDANLVAFLKTRHVKGNYIFTAGERVSGDRLLVTFLDETQFTKPEDIEVILKYPAKSSSGATISFVEIYADLSSELANAAFFDGGINMKYASILLECNQTRHYTYEIFIYGY